VTLVTVSTQNFKFLGKWSDWAEIWHVGPVGSKKVPNQISGFYLNATTFGEGLKWDPLTVSTQNFKFLQKWSDWAEIWYVEPVGCKKVTWGSALRFGTFLDHTGPTCQISAQSDHFWRNFKFWLDRDTVKGSHFNPSPNVVALR